MPRLIVVLVGAVCLSCSQEKPTSQPAQPHHSPAQGATVSGGDECPTEAFNIQLQFFTNVNAVYERALRRAANRWEGVIQGDLPSISFVSDPLNEWDSHLKARVRFTGIVDDLLIIVRALPLDNFVASSGVSYIRTRGKLPIVATIALDQAALRNAPGAEIDRVLLHEIGHCLGFGTTTIWDSFVKEWPATRSYHDPHFDGLYARVSFNQMGGRSYSGDKVPLDPDGGHWRSLLGDELMARGRTYPYRRTLSEITIGALDDLGYRVNYWGAEYYETPTAASKAHADQEAGNFGCEVVRKQVRER